jgi:putative membrane protein
MNPAGARRHPAGNVLSIAVCGGLAATRERSRHRQSVVCGSSGATVPGVNTLVKFALRVVVLAVIIFVVTRLVSGITVDTAGGQAGEVGTYLWVALLFAVVNSVVGPVLRLLSLPFVLLTLGLFLLVINAALLGITAAISARFSVDGVWSAIVGGFLIALFSWIAELLLPLRVRST